MRSLLLLFLLAISLPSRADDWSFVVSSGYRKASTCSMALSAERRSTYQEALRITKGNLPLRIKTDSNSTWCEKKTGDDGISKVYRTRPYAYSVFKYLGSPADIPASDLAADTIYNMAYTDEQCQAAYGGEMRSVTVPSGSLNTANAYVNTGACKLYQTPGVTFCTNNPDGTQECSTVWRAESTGEPNDPDAEGANVEESPFQLTDNPSSCANGSYSSGGKSYCYTGQSSDINTIHIGDDGNPVTDDGGTDTGGNTGGGDTGSGNDGGSTGGGGSSGGGSTGGGGSSGGGGGGASGGGGSTGGGSSDGGGGSSGGGSTGGGSTGGGSTGGGSTGGDTSTGGGDTSTDDDATPPDDTDTPSEGDTGSSDSGNNDSGDGEESEEPGDGLDAVLDAIGGVRKAINNGFSNLVDTFTNQDGAPTAADVESEFDGQGLTDDLMSQLDTQNEDVQGEITQRYRDLFEDDSSLLGKGLSYVKGVATAWLPEIPGGGGCVPLTFSFQGHTVTIECRVFDLIKAALSWLLFFFTCYQITMIALSYRSASEG